MGGRDAGSKSVMTTERQANESRNIRAMKGKN